MMRWGCLAERRREKISCFALWLRTNIRMKNANKLVIGEGKLNQPVTYVLIHSPLVGPSTWELVRRELEGHGLEVVVPTLVDLPDSTMPYWRQHAESMKKVFSGIATGRKIVLVSHSGSGPVLPAIRQVTDHPIAYYVFVDAGIPQDKSSRLDLMRKQDPDWAERFYQGLKSGKRFPMWEDEDLQDVIPNKDWRNRIISEINPRALPFFQEKIPVFAGWPDAPCAYIKYTASYEWDKDQAKRKNWLVVERNAMHFDMLVNPDLVCGEILRIVQE